MEQEQFEKYQQFTEKTIYDLSQKVTELESKLNVITNLLEISKYINKYIKDPNLFHLVNDIIVGVFGAKFSTIYVVKGEELEAVTSNFDYSFKNQEKQLIIDHNKEEFIIQSDTPIYSVQKDEENVQSCLGVPINIEDRLKGYIVVQHQDKNYFTNHHAMFLASIGNHIGVAIENSDLQRQISGIR